MKIFHDQSKTSENNISLNFRWVYSHTNETLHELLEKELSEVAGKPLGFKDCYGGE